MVSIVYQEKALVGAFSVIVQLHRLTDLRHYSCVDVEAAAHVAVGAVEGEVLLAAAVIRLVSKPICHR